MSQLSKKMAAEAAKPHQIAVYAHLTREDHFSVFEVQYETHDDQWNKLPPGEERECTRSDFVRISEVTSVVCRPIDEDTITQNAVKSLDSTADAIRTDMLQQLAEISNRKKQLLAITYQPEADLHPGEVIIQGGAGGNVGGDVVYEQPPMQPGVEIASVTVPAADFDDDIPF